MVKVKVQEGARRIWPLAQRAVHTVLATSHTDDRVVEAIIERHVELFSREGQKRTGDKTDYNDTVKMCLSIA